MQDLAEASSSTGLIVGKMVQRHVAFEALLYQDRSIPEEGISLCLFSCSCISKELPQNQATSRPSYGVTFPSGVCQPEDAFREALAHLVRIACVMLRVL